MVGRYEEENFQNAPDVKQAWVDCHAEQVMSILLLGEGYHFDEKGNFISDCGIKPEGELPSPSAPLGNAIRDIVNTIKVE